MSENTDHGTLAINSGEHFYTASTGERDLLARAGWVDEGIAWYGVK